MKHTGDVILSFTKSMSALLSAGLTVPEALSVCGTADKKTAYVCAYIRERLYEGIPLHSAMESVPSLRFPPLYSALIKIGEESGSVAAVFAKLAQYIERKKNMRRKILQTLLYPLLVCFLTGAVSIFIAVFIFPRLRDILEAFSAGTGTLDKKLEGFRTSMSVSMLLLLTVTAAVVLAAVLHSKSGRIKLHEDRIILKLPFVGKLVTTYCTRDFSFAMELLTASGVPLVKSLRNAGSVVQNSWYAEGIYRLCGRISEGKSFSEASQGSSIFPEYVVTWFIIGEKTGNIHSVFEQLHSYYENENDAELGTVLAAAEPLFILIAGSVLFFFVCQFVLPVFSILGGL
jgi:type II secretory pathway component PulF